VATFRTLSPPERVAKVNAYQADIDARHERAKPELGPLTEQALARAKTVRVQEGDLEPEVWAAEREQWLGYLGTLSEEEAAEAERELVRWLTLLRPFLTEPDPEEAAEAP
jgi:hypothetical protein